MPLLRHRRNGQPNFAIGGAKGLSTRKAEGRTGVNHADFTRIRNVQLDRFTIDRLITVLNRLGQRVDVRIEVHPRGAAEEAPAHR
ncbi:MAG: XRE family transcriptional regulator [Acidobacteriota bacterium]|nr:XRE family transcriptional regulator [Acidobacteriota bacterium]